MAETTMSDEAAGRTPDSDTAVNELPYDWDKCTVRLSITFLPGAVVGGGLVPVWMLAGASGVIASLWLIEDGLAKTFQERLYQYVLDGRRPDEGLALTQRDCISGKLGDAMTDPEAWAAFQFYGGLIPSEAKGFL
jgi:hypothetical protein